MAERGLPTGAVTFLFTDVEGSTLLARTLGAERWRDLLDLHARILGAPCEAAGGTRVRTEGDSFLFAFPQPTAAVTAAAAAQRALGATRWPHGATLRVRMGLHTGEAALGTPASGIDYVGFEVHRAARIASAGHGGQVLLSDTTRALTEHGLPPELEVRDLGEHALKDMTRPERLWQLAGPGLAAAFPAPRAPRGEAPAAAGPVPGPNGGAAPASLPPPGRKPARPLFGRDVERAQVLRGLDEAAAGQTTVTLLVGEGGIGKTTLAGAAERAARERGFRIAWGRCWETGDAPPLWPWSQALRSLGATRSLVALDGAAGVSTATAAAADGAEAASGARFQAMDAACAGLEEAARASGPVLLLLDDLHTADLPSLRFLLFVARTLRDTPLCIVGTLREVEARLDPERGRVLEQIGREATLLPLRRLAAADVAALARDRAGEALGEALAVRLFEVTEGNPLFVDEAVRLVLSRGGDARLAADGAALVGGGVAGTIRARLDRLGDEARRAVEAAAVLGRESGEAALAEVSALSGSALRVALDEVARAAVLVPREGGGQVFTHILLREAALGGIPSAGLGELHRRAALALAARVPPPDSALSGAHAATAARDGATPAAVAHHFIASGDFGQALTWTRRGGQEALARLAFEEAARLWLRLLEPLEAPGAEPRARCEARLRLGQARILADDGVRGRQDCKRAAEEAAALGAGDLLVEAALAYGAQFIIADSDPDMVRLLRAALAAVPPENLPSRARVAARLSSALLPGGDPDEAAALAREAIGLARASGDSALILDTLHDSYGSGLRYENPMPQRLAEQHELVSLGLALGRPFAAINGYVRAFRDHLDAGDPSGARAMLDGHEALTRQVGSRFNQSANVMGHAALALLAGRFEEAERIGEDIGRERSGLSEAMAKHATTMWRVGAAYTRFDPGEAERLLSLLSLERAFARNAMEVFAGWCAAAAGRRDEALAQLAQPAPLRGHIWLSSFVIEADAAALVHDGRHAQLHYRRLLPVAGTMVSWGPMFTVGPVDRVLACLAELGGDRAAADRHAAAAADLCRRAGAVPFAARLALDEGERLLGREDRAGAVAALEAAAERARAAGMPILAERAERSLAAARAAP